MEKTTLDVKGMTCKHCVIAVEDSLSNLEGVNQVTVHLPEERVDVEFDPDTVSEGKMKEAIEKQGYEVVGYNLI
ncbi:copper chaperone [Peribacillus deserti]|uniref:Copper chaperone CopZ n=1 Tax=Peribacillus deserti TaxID=673318 RepID=A0ABS2QM23_9BACI|nr:copper chaperone CopZ [Peribacillus deserti]MBM7694218.1 copper chaperone [Peribacillus deserti]